MKQMTDNPMPQRDARDPVIILTRPKDGSDEFALDLGRALPDAQIVQHPLQQMSFRERPSIGVARYGSYVFTSAQGVDAALRWNLPAKPCFCVGSKTAAAAGVIGGKVHDAKGTAQDLIHIMASEAVQGPALYISGTHISVDLVSSAAGVGVEIDRVIGYEQSAVDPDPALRALLSGGNPVILPLFSARSARLLLSVEQPRPNWHIIAISQKVAAIFDNSGVKMVDVASCPDGPSMKSAVCHAWNTYI